MTRLDDVRTHLMKALAGLADTTNPMDIARAKAVAEVATVLINSAKVEVDYLKVTKGTQGPFFQLPG